MNPKNNSIWKKNTHSFPLLPSNSSGVLIFKGLIMTKLELELELVPPVLLQLLLLAPVYGCFLSKIFPSRCPKVDEAKTVTGSQVLDYVGSL